MKKLLTTILIMTIAACSFSQDTAKKIAHGKQSVEQLKNSPAGSKILAVLNAINAQGEKVNEDFVKKHFSPASIERNGVERLIDILVHDIPDNEGKLTVYEISRQDKLNFIVFAKASHHFDWLEMGFKIEEDNPYRIEGLSLDVGGPGPAKVGATMKIVGK